MGRFIKNLIFIVLLFPLGISAQEVEEFEIKIIQGHYRHQYFRYFLEEVLTLARNEFGDFKVIPFDCGSEKECVENGSYLKGDILYSPSENWDLTDFRRVEAPILSGLLGLRLPVYEYKNRQMIEGIKGAADYKKLRVSFNRNWRDFKILKKSKFKLVAVDSFSGIYHALNNGSADYTLRGVSEAYIEVLNQKQNLLVDNKNFIYYNYPVYLYVRKNNKRLYRAIILGMSKLNSQTSNYFTKNFIEQNIVLEERLPCQVYNVTTEVIQVIKQCNVNSLMEVVANFRR